MNLAEIRAAQLEDAEGIAKVIVSAWRDTYRGLMPDHVLDHLSVEERAERWKKRLEDGIDPYHRVLVTEANGRVTGFASYGSNLEDDPQYRGEIHALYILNEYRSQGLGRKLVFRAASALLDLNMNSMVVWVLSANPYRKFYERLGGKYLYEKPGLVSGILLEKTAYSWEDLNSLTETGG